MYKQWLLFGPLTGLIKHSGIFNTQPLWDFINGVFMEFGYQIKRKVQVSCVDINTGSYVVFDEHYPDLARAILGSAAIPFVFPHQHFDELGVICMDGGTVWNTNLVGAVKRCRETVDDDTQITVDIVICSSPGLSQWIDRRDARSNYLRYREVRDYYDSMGDILEFMIAFPKVNFRHLVMPSTPLPGSWNLLNFDNKTNTWPMQVQGRKDGAVAVKAGEGFYFDEMKIWYGSA